MRAALPLALAALVAGCTGPPRTAPLLVGPGPCPSDVVSRDAETGRVLRGCVAVLLVEATASADRSAVEGRVLVAGALDPLPGATVYVAGDTSRGAASDRRGRFTLGGLRPEDHLVVSYVGFWPDTLAVGALPGPRARP